MLLHSKYFDFEIYETNLDMFWEWFWPKRVILAILKSFPNKSLKPLQIIPKLKSSYLKIYKNWYFTLTLSRYSWGAMIFLWWTQIGPLEAEIPRPNNGPRSFDKWSGFPILNDFDRLISFTHTIWIVPLEYTKFCPKIPKYNQSINQQEIGKKLNEHSKRNSKPITVSITPQLQMREEFRSPTVSNRMVFCVLCLWS